MLADLSMADLSLADNGRPLGTNRTLSPSPPYNRQPDSNAHINQQTMQAERTGNSPPTHPYSTTLTACTYTYLYAREQILGV